MTNDINLYATLYIDSQLTASELDKLLSQIPGARPDNGDVVCGGVVFTVLDNDDFLPAPERPDAALLFCRYRMEADSVEGVSKARCWRHSAASWRRSGAREPRQLLRASMKTSSHGTAAGLGDAASRVRLRRMLDRWLTSPLATAARSRGGARRCSLPRRRRWRRWCRPTGRGWCGRARRGQRRGRCRRRCRRW
jgi:hypothetical protein